MKLVNPANKRKYTVIVVGTGLAGASAAARSASSATTSSASASTTARAARTASPRRAASTPPRTTRTTATASTGSSTTRSRAATSARARPTSTGWRSCRVEHHRPVRRAGRAVRARVRRPARQPLVRRRAGVAHVLRARPDGPAAAARRLPGADAAGGRRHGDAASRAARCSTSSSSTARRAASSCRNLVTGEIERHAGDAVVLATGGYGNVFYLSTNAVNSNVTAAWRAHKRGALFANPCFTQIHPTCIPVSGDHQSKLTLMSECLRNDGRVWVPKNARRQPAARHRSRRTSATTTSSGKYPSFGNLVPRDVASRAAKEVCDEGRGVGDDRAGGLSRLRRRHPAPRRRDDRGALRQPLRHVRAHHRRGPVPGRRCGSTPPSTTRWAGSGSTTT